MPIAGVVADANVLLSAVVGKAALRVFTEFDVCAGSGSVVGLADLVKRS